MSFSCLSPHHRDEWLKVAWDQPWDLLGTLSPLYSAVYTAESQVGPFESRPTHPYCSSLTHPSHQMLMRLQGEQT